MLSSDWSRMGSCPASNTMYYNVSSGWAEREGGEEKKKREKRNWKIKKGEREGVKLQRRLVKQQLSIDSH